MLIGSCRVVIVLSVYYSYTDTHVRHGDAQPVTSAPGDPDVPEMQGSYEAFHHVKSRIIARSAN